MPANYVLACGHPQYGETGYCSEMSCSMYYSKHLGEPRPAISIIQQVATITPVDPIAYAFASERRLAEKHGVDENYEQALDAAIELITMAGFDPDDSDAFGSPMEDTVQTLLTMALVRCPQLADRIMGHADDGVKIVAERDD